MSGFALGLLVLLILWFIIDLGLLAQSGPRLRIVILEDDPNTVNGGLRFEAENVGDKPTSLYPVIAAAFITANGERREICFDIQDSDLTLPVLTPRRLTASARHRQPERMHGHNKRYCFDYGAGAAIEVTVE